MFQIFGMKAEFEFLSHRIGTEIDPDMIVQLVCRPHTDVFAAVFPGFAANPTIAENRRDPFRGGTAKNLNLSH